MESEKKLYLPGLNGIRAIAACIVLYFHIDGFGTYLGLKVTINNPEMGNFGVSLFFVLSGYLITQLLLLEKKKTGSIALKKFYIRRILRIWPLYFLYIFIGVACTYIFQFQKTETLFLRSLYYVFFLPNIAFAFKQGIAVLGNLWSVGVEEQFYAFWPILINKSRRLLLSMICVIIIFILFAQVSRKINHNLFVFFGYTRIGCMATGGIGAWWAFNGMYAKKIIFHPATQFLAWSIFTIGVFSNWVDKYMFIGFLHYFPSQFWSGVFIILILNVSLNANTVFRLENTVFQFLGKISYGIYVYHFLIMYILVYFLKDRIHDTLILRFLFFGLSVFCTISVAAFSHRYFESYFLRIKNKFAIIKSTSKKTAPTQPITTATPKTAA